MKRKNNLLLSLIVSFLLFLFFSVNSLSIVHENDINFSWLESYIYNNDNLGIFYVDDSLNRTDYNNTDFYEHTDIYNSLYYDNDYISNNSYYYNESFYDVGIASIIHYENYFYIFNGYVNEGIYLYDDNFTYVTTIPDISNGLYESITSVSSDSNYFYILTHQSYGSGSIASIRIYDFNLSLVDTIHSEYNLAYGYYMNHIRYYDKHLYLGSISVSTLDDYVLEFDLNGNLIDSHDISVDVNAMTSFGYYQELFYVFDELDKKINIFDNELNFIEEINRGFTYNMYELYGYENLFYTIFLNITSLSFYLEILNMSFYEEYFYDDIDYYPFENGLIHNISNLNVNFTQESNRIDGYYNATYSFDDLSELNDFYLYENEIDTFIDVVNESNHYNVLQMYKNDVYDDYVSISNNFSQQDYGTVEFWLKERMNDNDTLEDQLLYYDFESIEYYDDDIVLTNEFDDGYDGTMYNFDGNDEYNGIKGSYSLDFDGNNDYVDSGLTLDQTGTNDYLISLWFNTDESGTVQFLFSTYYTNYEFGIFITSSNTIGIHNGAGFVNTGYSINTAQWYHLSAEFVHGSGIRIFVNGNSIYSGGISTSPTTNSLHIGIRGDESASTEFNGKVDDFRVLEITTQQSNNFMLDLYDCNNLNIDLRDDNNDTVIDIAIEGKGLEVNNTAITSFQWDTFYHIRIDFESTTGNYMGLFQNFSNIYVNNELIGTYQYYYNSSITNIIFNSSYIESNMMFHIDAIGYSWDTNYDINDNFKNNSFHNEWIFMNETYNEILSIECIDGIYYIDSQDIDYNIFFDNETSIDDTWKVIIDVDVTNQELQLNFSDMNDVIIHSYDYNLSTNNSIRYLKHIHYYENSEHSVNVSNIYISSNNSLIVGNNGYLSYYLDLIETDIWNFQTSTILNITGNGIYRFYVSNDTYENNSIITYQITNWVIINNEEISLNLASFTFNITNPYLIVETITGMYLLEELKISNEESFILIDDRGYTYGGVFEYQNVNISHSYFYIDDNVLYFKMDFIDNGLEYIKLTFDIVNVINENYQLIYNSYLNNSDTSITSQINIINSDGSFESIDIPYSYNSDIEILWQTKVSSKIEFYISDNDLFIENDNVSISGSIDAFTFNYNPNISLDIFIEQILIMLIPIIIILTFTLVLSYMFRNKNKPDKFNKQIFFPLFFIVSILVFILGYYDTWILFILIVSLIVYLIKKRGTST